MVNADIKVISGKRIDVTIRHRCATLTLKLVNKPAGEALANTTFTVLTPGGDVIRELVGAFPSLVLAEGEYVVIARHEVQGLPIDVPGSDRDGPRHRSCCRRRAANRGRDRMQTFFVQIKCALGRTYEVASALAEAEIASEIYSIAGDYDILAKFYVESDVDIGHFVGHKVQVIPGIVDTRTIITFKAF